MKTTKCTKIILKVYLFPCKNLEATTCEKPTHDQLTAVPAVTASRLYASPGAL